METFQDTEVSNTSVWVFADKSADFPYDLLQGLSCWTVREAVHEAFSEVACHTDPGVKWHSAQEWDAHVLAELLATPQLSP